MSSNARDREDEQSDAKRSRMMVESTSATLSETRCDDDDTLFASGIERLHAAQKELELAQKNMKDIRQHIRVQEEITNQILCYTYVMGMTIITSYHTY